MCCNKSHHSNFRKAINAPALFCWHLFLNYFFKILMSQAFVKEEDGQWLHDIAPTLNALINYLTRENNGIRIYEKQSLLIDGREAHLMSNGLTYMVGEDHKWSIVD